MTRAAVSPAKPTFGKTAAVASVLALVLGCAPAAHAAPPPFGKTEVSIMAREQPIAVFLQDFFRQAGMTAVVSPEVTGNVNGTFNGPASTVYPGIARAFNLLTYYDGTAAYIYPASQAAESSLSSATPYALLRQVKASGLLDEQDQVHFRAGQVVVSGARRFLDQMSDLAGHPGAPAAGPAAVGVSTTTVSRSPLEYRIYYLRYAWAEDVTLTFSGRQVTLPGVASILSSLVMDGGGGQTVRRTETMIPGFGAGGPGMPGLPNPNTSALGAVGAVGQPGGGRDPGTLGFNLAAYGSMPPPGNAAAWNQVAAQGGGYTLQSQVGGGESDPRVVADNRLNAVIVRDTRAHLDAYDQLIRALDVEPQLVEIQTSIIDIDTDKVRTLGAGFQISDITGNEAFTLGTGNGGFVGPPAGGGVFTASFTAGDVRFRAGLQALVSKGAAQVVAQPQVLTLSDVEAVFDNSKTFYVRVSGVQAADLYNITAGTTLRVTPHVTRDQGQTRIRMLIAIQDGSLSGQSVDRIPVVSNSGINTQALLLEGQSLLLGGLVTQTDRHAVDKVPIAGDIPVLGFLFRNSVKESAHTERLFLLTPRLVSIGAANAPPATSNIPPQYQPAPAPPSAYVPSTPPPPSPVPQARVKAPSH